MFDSDNTIRLVCSDEAKHLPLTGLTWSKFGVGPPIQIIESAFGVGHRMAEQGNLTDSEVIAHWWDGDPEGLHDFAGYKVPISLILKTGAGPSVFDQIALGHQLALEKWIGIEPHLDVFEFGCGIGRDSMWLSQILTTGSYTGIDIIADSITWCQKNISTRRSNFSFHHFDVADDLHNPDGQSSANLVRFPREDNSVDRIFAFSVFTHMFADQIAHYLAETARVLRPGGRAYLTIFLYDEGVLESAQRHAVTPFDLKFATEIEPGCRVNDPDQPLGAIAYEWQRIEPLIRSAGLKLIRRPLNGSWSGYYATPDDGQDVLLLEKE
jgi:SAM-dependent methyltransferase